MINKKTYSINEDHKVLHKVGKRWVTVSTLLLGLIGGATMVAHGASADVKPTARSNGTAAKTDSNNSLLTSNQSQFNPYTQTTIINKSNNSASAITSQAKQLHSTLMSPNRLKPTSNSTRADAKPSINSNNKNNLPTSNKGMTTFTLGTPAQQARGWNYINANRTPNSHKDSKPKLFGSFGGPTKHNVHIVNYFSGNITNSSNDLGLNYKAFANGGVEITGGTAQAKLSDFSKNNDILNAKAIKFDNNIDTANVTSMSDMFASDSNLKALSLGNNFNTTNVADMYRMFHHDTNLQEINLPDSFDTKNVTIMEDMFSSDNNLQVVSLGRNFSTKNVNDMSNMFANDNDIQFINIQSPNTKLNNSINLPYHLYKTTGSVDANGNPYTNSTTITNGISGTYIKNSNTESNSGPQKHASDGHWIYDNGYYLSDGEVHDWIKKPIPSEQFSGDFINSTILYSPSTQAAEITGGKAIALILIPEHIQDLFNAQQPLSSLKLDDNINVTQLEGAANLFYGGSDLHSVDLDIDLAHADYLGNLFMYLSHVQSLLLGPKCTFNNDAHMNDMFHGDTQLKSLPFSSDFTTKQVSDMARMFYNDNQLIHLSFPSKFDTRTAINNNNDNMLDMFTSHIQDIIIKSPNTKFTSDSGVPHKMYTALSSTARDSDGNFYTTMSDGTWSNNKPHLIYSDGMSNKYTNIYGNPGAFSIYENPADIIQYRSNGKIVGQQFVKPNYTKGNQKLVLINNNDTKIANYRLPDNYQQILPLDCKTHIIDVTPSNEQNSIIYTNNLIGPMRYYHTQSITGLYNSSAASAINQFQPSDCQIVATPEYSNEFGQSNLKSATIGPKDTHIIVNVSYTPAIKVTFYLNHNANNQISKIPVGNKGIHTTSASSIKISSDIPVGYQLANPSNSNINISPNTSSLSVAVIPTTATATYNYMLPNGSSMSGGTSKGNWYTDSSAENTSFNISSGNANLPSGYQLAHSDNNVPYNNETTMIDVVPVSASASYNYILPNGKSLSGGTAKGNWYTDSLAGNTSFNINSSDASSYHLPDYYQVNSATNVPFNNETTNINIRAKSASETVDYKYNNNIISSSAFSGNSASATLAGDNSAVLTNQSGVPAYYQLSNSANSDDVPFNNSSMNVDVVPDKATDTIDYMFNNSQISNSTISGNDVSAKGANNTYATIAAPINYHLANSTNSTTIAYDGKTHQINIVPNNETNAIKYMYNGNQVGSAASISGAFNAPAQSAIDQHLPNGYKFINNDDNLKFDNERQRQINVTVASDATDIVGFYDSRNNNLVGRLTIKQPKGSICTITRQQVPTGWHLVNNTNQFQVEPNMTSNIRVMQDNIPAKDQPNYAIPVAPTIVSDSITYNNGKEWTTQKKINGQTGTSAKSDVDKNLPIGYQVSGNSDTFNYPESNSTKIIGIKPIVNNEKVFYKDTANNYKVITSANISGNDSSAQNASDTNFNANSKLPQGYQLAESQPTNIAYDGYNHDIDITPIKQTDTVIFINNDNHKTVETKSISGNDYRTNDNGTATVELPISYHLAKGQSNVVNYDSTTHQISINYDGTKHHISIIPNTANIDINYQYNGTTISSHRFNGNNSSAKNASDTTVNVTPSNEPNIPQGYHLANTKNKFSYDNNSHNVAILPNHVSDTINYQYNGKTLSSNKVGGNDYRATNAHDNSIDITSSNDSGIPQGYHLSNTNNTFNYDGNTHNVIIEPNTDTDIVDYNYGNQTLSNHNFSGNDSHATNAGNNSFEINDTNEPGIPDGYHLANKESSFNYDNQTHIVQIVPNSVSDIINYRLNNQIITSHTFHGNDYRATAAGNNTVNINNNNVPDMPRGYTLVNKNNQFNYDGQNHNVAIKPIQDTDEIDYVYNNQILAHHNFTGNDQYAVQAGNINFDINKQNDPDLPQGYQLVNDDNQFKYDNKKHLVDIKPILQTDTIDYQLNNQTISSHQFTGNDYRASQAGNNSFSITNTDAPGIPQGYALVNSNNTFNYDGQSHNVAIKATNQNATVQYYSPNRTLIYKGIIKGNVGTKVQLNPPAGYHNNGAIPIYYFNPANASHNPSARISVVPNTINGKAIIHIKYALNNPDGTPFKIINGNDQYVNINGKYGDSPIVISPIQYQPTNDAYHSDVTNKPFSINISNLTKDGSKSNYTISDTFTYDATEAPNLVLHYDVISNNNGSVKRNNICENVYKPSDLGIRLQDWVIGNTITLHDGNQHGTTNVIHAPYGYHLMPQAKGFAYHNGSETIVLKPNAIDKITKRPIMLMAMPLFVRHVAPKPKPAHHIQPKPSPIVPSDNRTNQPKVVPSDEIAKIIARAKVNQPKVVSDVTPNKSTKAQSKPNQVIINRHTKHNHVNRNNNDKSAKSSTVSPTTYSKSNYANNYYDDNVSLPDITSSNVGINTPHKNNTIDDTDSHSKLPQTGDSNRIASMASIIMLLTSITLAGADLDRKHRLD